VIGEKCVADLNIGSSDVHPTQTKWLAELGAVSVAPIRVYSLCGIEGFAHMLSVKAPFSYGTSVQMFSLLVPGLASDRPRDRDFPTINQSAEISAVTT
jgi:hypothetical protein